MRGVLSETLAIQAAKDMNLGGAEHFAKREVEEDWGYKNDQLVRAIVRIQKLNGDDDTAAYGKVQQAANKAVGIKRKDKMTPVDVLKKRHAYLLNTLRALRDGAAWEGVE